jgi:flagellar hook-length control protein FliK
MKAHQAHFRDRIEMLAAAKASEAVTLLIDPKGLGEIRVTLTQREGAVEAHAASPDERVREVLASSHQDLQRQFDQRGLKLERFTVDSSLADSSSRGYNPDSARGHQGHTPPRPQFTGVQIETSQPVHRRVPTGALDLAI